MGLNERVIDGDNVDRAMLNSISELGQVGEDDTSNIGLINVPPWNI